MSKSSPAAPWSPISTMGFVSQRSISRRHILKSKDSLGVFAVKAGLESSRSTGSSKLITLVKISFSGFFSEKRHQKFPREYFHSKNRYKRSVCFSNKNCFRSPTLTVLTSTNSNFLSIWNPVFRCNLLHSLLLDPNWISVDSRLGGLGEIEEIRGLFSFKMPKHLSMSQNLHLTGIVSMWAV